jgi:hypothetical protein
MRIGGNNAAQLRLNRRVYCLDKKLFVLFISHELVLLKQTAAKYLPAPARLLQVRLKTPAF